MIRLAVILALALAPLCGPDTRDADADAEADSGIGFAMDAGAGDADAMMAPPTPDSPLRADRAESNLDGLGECEYAEESAVDCSADCIPAATCCVGETSCCVVNTDDRFDFASCEAGACLQDRAGSALAFGTPRPRTREGSVILGGDGEFDSGFFFPREFDLRTEGLSVTATFTPPDACDSCVESAAIAVTTQRTMGDNVHVDIHAGVVFTSASASLWVANEVVDSVSLTESEEWTLTLSADGLIIARSASGKVLSRRYEPVPNAHLVLFGHSQNPEPFGARFDSLAIRSTICNMPRAVRERVSVPVPVANVSGPAIALDPADRTTIAFASDGLIYIGADPGADPTELVVLDTENPALQPSDGKRYESPELLSLEDHFVLMATERDEDGTSKIVFASGGTEPANYRRFGALSVALDPSSDADVTSFDQPTVTRFDALFIVVVRAHLTSGQRELRAFYGSELTSLSPFAGKLADFSRGGVSEPSLTLHGGSYHLYFTRKVGARKSIVMLVSPDMRVFRDMGTVLRAESEDGISVESLDVSVDPEAQLVHYVYLGDDGRQRRMRRAVRRASFEAPSR